MNAFSGEEEKLYIYLNRAWDSNPLILTSYVMEPLIYVTTMWISESFFPYMYTSFHVNGYDKENCVPLFSKEMEDKFFFRYKIWALIRHFIKYW